jgi:predicted GNAT family acetyltransferase
MKLFGSKKAAPQRVTSGRFELEQDGQVAYLEYKLTGNILELSHTEVPEALRGKGLSAELAHTALEYARENHLKVDIVCPQAARYIQSHPEYSDLVM